MIVVDTDVIAAFWLPTERTKYAVQLRRRESNWIAPILWRSEFRSVLRKYLVQGQLTLAECLWVSDRAEGMLRGREYGVKTPDVMKLVQRTGHSSYDCEFVALALAKGIKLVTGDHKLCRLFPDTAIALDSYST